MVFLRASSWFPGLLCDLPANYLWGKFLLAQHANNIAIAGPNHGALSRYLQQSWRSMMVYRGSTPKGLVRSEEMLCELRARGVSSKPMKGVKFTSNC